MLNRPSKAAIIPAVLAIGVLVAALLLLLLVQNQVLAQEGGVIRYTENDTKPVRVFTSTDPEGANIDWDVTGTDADDFDIKRDSDGNGVLRFWESPNYERPSDRGLELSGDSTFSADDGDFVPEDNLYQITVRATEERAGGAMGRALSTESHITVEVVNLEEPGVVQLNRLQPEVGTMITATLTDPDVAKDDPAPTWAWFTSKVDDPDPNVPSDWNLVEGQVTESYMPAGDRVASVNADDEAVDEGKYLRAMVMYRDGQGDDDDDDKTAVLRSAYPVRAEVFSDNDPGEGNRANGSPGFNLDTADIAIPENTPVGDPVGGPAVATDPNTTPPNIDILTYELDSDEDPTTPVDADLDVAFFKVDQETGQIEVAKKLDFESKTNEITEKPDGVYTIVIRATDPSGEFANQTLRITAGDVNDAPEVMNGKAELLVFEQDSDDKSYTGGPNMVSRTAGTDPLDNTYTGSDQDEFDSVTWSLEGDDASLFLLSAVVGVGVTDEPRDLKFRSPPDYESPADRNWDNVYKVIVVATDENQGVDKRPVTVIVDNVHEMGKITLSTQQPLIGEAITAWVTDPDEGVAVITWQWHRGVIAGTVINYEPIEGATSDTYTPKGDNPDTDAIEDLDQGKHLRATATYVDTTSDEDKPGTPELDERVQKEGQGLNATPAPKTPDGTDGAGDTSDRLYLVTADSEFTVRVKEGDVDIGSTPTAPVFPVGPVTREVAENARIGDYVGAPVRAAGVGNMYTLGSGVGDHLKFQIDPEYGQLSVAGVGTRPDLDYEVKSIYNVEVTARNAQGEEATAEVSIELTNLNETPYFVRDTQETDHAILAEKRFPEKGGGAVANYHAVDPDKANNVDWYLTGVDAADFTIDGGVLKFGTEPDFENPTDRAYDDDRNGTIEDNEASPNNMYQITVRATEKTAVGGGPLKSKDIDVTVIVTNVNEDGTADLSLLQPQVDTEIMVSLDDPDGDVQNERYTWYKSKVQDPSANPDPVSPGTEWELIPDATSATYIPRVDAAITPDVNESDVGKYLLARGEYEDTTSSADDVRERVAIAISAYKVQEVPASNDSPDFADAHDKREVLENIAVGANVGAAVSVPVNVDNDILTYGFVTLASENDDVVVGDLAYFAIDKATAQITVTKALSFENNDGRTYTENAPPTAGEYTVVVRAIDPSMEVSGAHENRDDITVTINVGDVNEAPKVSSGDAEIELPENDALPVDGGNDDSNLYQWEDEDKDDSPRWELEGVDSALFQFSSPGTGRRIHFKEAPDYENPADRGGDNVYDVTVVVIDNGGLEGVKAVRIEVTNVNEAGAGMGMLSVSPEQPHLGEPVVAALTDPDGIMTEPDGEQTIVTWQWYWTNTDVDLPEVEQDGENEGNFVNVPREGTAGKIGGATTNAYTPVEGDVGNFLHVRVTYRDGHNTEDDPRTEEADESVTDDRELVVKTGNAVQQDAPDTVGGPALNVAPVFDPLTGTLLVPENLPSTGYVGPSIVAADVGALVYDLSGTDSNRFALADKNMEFYEVDNPKREPGLGQIVLRPVTHLDHESGKVYSFEIGATDSQGERSTDAITVEVTDVNEAPSEPVEFFGGFAISGLHEVIYDENDTIMVAAYEGVRPPSGTQVSWDKSGDDADDFEIILDSDGMGLLRFSKQPPNYEKPTDKNTNNVYEINVDATAGRAEYSIPVTITVINEEEPGTVTLSTDAPRVGVEVTADLDDDDRPVRIVWEWSRSTETPGLWNVIASSASNTYLPGIAIVGWELRATARYDDGHSSGKMARKATTQQVTTAPTFPDSEDGMRSVDENSAEGTDVGDAVTASYADRYALSGTDATSFSIDEATGQIKVGTGTVLDFETKDSYMVIVTATDAAGISESLDVTIDINNVDEPGSVTLDPEMPRAEEAITATLADPDEAGRVTWRWESSGDGADPWTPIEGATDASYMVAKADSGMFLRARASYTDEQGGDKTADSEATTYAVAPAFPDSEDGMRSVDENSAEGTEVGDPVTASNAVRYALSGAYAASFSINADTGQIMVGTGTVLDFEMMDSYMVTVIATDAAGSSEELMVTININNVDEPGSVSLSTEMPRTEKAITATLEDPDNVVDTSVKWRWESSADGADPWTPIEGATDASYMVAKADSGMFLRAMASYADEHGGGKTKESEATTYAVAPAFPDSEDGMRSVDENSGEGTDVGDPVTASNADSYALSGTDATSFSINGATGQIMVGTGTMLDFETADSYMVTVIATDAAGISEDLMVTININNVEEPGSVSLSTEMPRAGEAITATPEDPDNVVDTSVAWWWESSADGADPWTPIGASDASYMVAKADSGMFLRARASYTDGEGGGKTAESEATTYAVAPAFPDSEDGMRSVDENSAEGTDVGDPVTASNAFSYALSGTDAASFSINEATGQIKVGAGTVLNFETENSYMVTVTATDAAGSSEELMVTININNVEEPGSVSLSTEMPRAGAEITAATPEDPDNVVDGSVTWQWESSADGADPWTPIEGATDASYMVAKADSGMFLRAMASYTDEHGGGKTAESEATTYAVAPAFPDSEDGMRSVDENSGEGTDVGDPVTASNADSYALSGTDATSFSINGATGQIMVGTGTMLDFETADSYMVTVIATDAAGISEDLMVTININNVEEPGTVTLSTDAPRPEAEITATLADPDNVVDGSVTWQWESGDGEGAWTAIDGATDATYMVGETDRGNYLRAMAMYTDGYGPDEAVSDATANAVAGNAAPVFDAETAERMVAENTAAGENIGAPVAATDADTGDTLTYTLGGTDAASFAIDASTGQLQVKDALDFETETSYEVEVTATDESSATDTVTVTITVTDESLGALGDTYDSNGDEMIDRDDLVAAVRAFRGNVIDRDDLVALVRLFQRTLGS